MKQFKLKNIMLDIQEYTVWANNLREAKDIAIQGHAPHNDNHPAYWVKLKV